MIMNDFSGKIRKKRYVLRFFVLIGGALLIGVSLYGLFRGSYLILEKQRVKSLEEENTRLKARLLNVEEQIKILSSLIDTLYVRDLALRTMAGLEYPPSEYQEIAIGGTFEPGTNSGGDQLEIIEKEVDKLLKFSEYELTSYEEIQAKLEEDQRRRDHTPSIIPVRGFLSSRFGYRRDPFTGQRRFHEGLDIVAPVGMPIVAPADGRVKRVKWESGFGLVLEIDHGYGIVTRYAHTSRVLVRPGQVVKRGQVIAYVGNTGRSTGPHLHYEVRINGRPTNPLKFIIPAGVYYD